MANSAVGKLTTGGTIVAGAGIVFLLDSFLPWHRTCFELLKTSTCVSESAWGTAFSLLATLLVLALVGEVIAVQIFDQKLPAVGTFTWAQIRLVAAGAAAVLVLLQLLVGDHGLGRGYGIFLGILLAAGVAYGTWVRGSEPEPVVPIAPIVGE